jgi:DNA polymerase
MASAIYNKQEADISKDERFVGKTTILGAGYGMGAKKFQAQLKTFGVDLSEAETQRTISVYRETYDWIPLLWRRAGDALEAILNDQAMDLGRGGVLKVEGKKGIRLPNGLYIKYPNLRKVENENGKLEYFYDTRKGKATIPNKIYGGKVVENVCQALARIIIGYQMLTIAKKYKVVMTVHDAIAIVAPEAQKDAAQEFVEMCMRLRPEWALELPLNCESGVGVSYGDC